MKLNKIKKSLKGGDYSLPITVFIVLIGIYFFGKSIFNYFFNGSPDDNDKESLNAILDVGIDWSKITITEDEAKQRAQNIYNAFNQWGTDEVAVVKQLVKKEYQTKVSDSSSSVLDYSMYLNPFTAVGFSIYNYVNDTPEMTYAKVYKEWGHEIGLSNEDYILIAQKFGLKAMGYGQGYATLPEYVRSEDEGQLLELFEEIYKTTQIQI